MSAQSGRAAHTKLDPIRTLGASFLAALAVVSWTSTSAMAGAPPPKVASVVINNGAAQRSRVTSVQIDFDGVVAFTGVAASAFQLQRMSDNVAVTLSVSASNSTFTRAVLTWVGTGTEFGSLQDGRWRLRIIATAVSGPGGNLDGDGNGTGGDDYVLASALAPSAPTNVFRHFGDGDGDGDVDAVDFLGFRVSLVQPYSPAYDFDGDGDIDATDFLQLRDRFLVSVLP